MTSHPCKAPPPPEKERRIIPAHASFFSSAPQSRTPVQRGTLISLAVEAYSGKFPRLAMHDFMSLVRTSGRQKERKKEVRGALVPPLAPLMTAWG